MARRPIRLAWTRPDPRKSGAVAERLRSGNFGDWKSLGNRIGELRIDAGPGYRVYFTRVGSEIVVLLAGGDKSSQARDIRKAKLLAEELAS